MDIEEKVASIRKSWQYRAIEACRGNQTPTGLILLAVLRRMPRHPPAMAQHAEIDQDGVVRVRLVNRFFQRLDDVPVCNVKELNEQFNRLADMIQATDEERMDMFAQVRGWISIDHRTKNDVVLN